MKKLFLLISMLPILAMAGTLTEVSSFSSPDQYSNGLAWDGTNLWLHGGFYDGFYEINTSGTVLSSFSPTEPGGDNACGCTFDGTNLWAIYLASIGVPGDVYEYQTDGTYVSDFTLAGTGNYCFGMAYDGTNLWVSCTTDDNIYEITTSGTVISSFISPVSGLKDLGWTGTNLLIAAGTWIYEVSTSGTTVDTYSLSGICSTATGMTYDGSHFWITDQTTDIVYELDPGGAGIESASLGTIKSMFK